MNTVCVVELYEADVEGRISMTDYEIFDRFDSAICKYPTVVCAESFQHEYEVKDAIIMCVTRHGICRVLRPKELR